MILVVMSKSPCIDVAFEASSVDALSVIYKLYKPSWETPSWETIRWDLVDDIPVIYERDFRFLIASCYRIAKSDMDSSVWKLRGDILAFRCRGSFKSAFHLAAEHGDPELIEALFQIPGIDRTSHLHTCDADGNSPLSLAAAKGKVAAAKLLHSAGTINRSNCFGLEPIAAATANGHWDAAKSLALYYNGDPPFLEEEHLISRVFFGCGLQNYNFARWLTESIIENDPAKVREGLKLLPLRSFERGFQALLQSTSQPALHMAAAHGSSEIVRLLVQTGADVNWEVNVRHIRAFEQSRDEEFFEEVHRYLPESRINVRKGNQEKPGLDEMVRPLHLAIYRGFPDVVRLLVRSGADINPTNRQLHPPPPLHFAAESGSWEILRTLLDEHVKVTGRDCCGATALHYAAISGSIKKVVGLVEEGCRLKVKDCSGWTPLIWFEIVHPISGRQSSLIRSFLKSECRVSSRPSTWARAFK